MTHLHAGRLDAAARLCAQARLAAPGGFDVYWISGVAAFAQNDFAGAAEWLGRARRLAPDDAACALRLGFSLAKLARHEEAEGVLLAAVALAPADPEAWDTLGFVLAARGRIADAVAAHRRSVEARPGRAGGWHNLGNALMASGRLTEALAAHERAVAADPSVAASHHGRAMALYQCHRLPEAAAGFADALARNPCHADARSYRLMTLNYLDGLSRESVFAAHASFGSALERGRPHGFAAAADPGRRLRIGFLSPDLRTHSVTYFLEPLLRHLPASGFEVFLYHDHYIVDAVSERLRARTASWRNLFGMPDDAAAAAIRADKPDVMVDLAGHTGFNRVRLFARRLAPVQVSYLGYPNTSGIAEIDHRLVDPVTDPEGDSEPFHTERLVRFAPTAWCYAPPPDAPEPSAPLSAAGGPVVFGSFSNFGKVTDAALSAWARLLGAVPGSLLRLKTTGLDEPGIRAQVQGRLTRAGIDLSRAELLGRAPSPAEHLAHYRSVDVALDTFPYNGTTTTCEALWMGVPVVTLSGDRHASRVGASLLTAIDRKSWITRDWDGYVETAAGVGRDTRARASLGRELRDDMLASALLDHPGQAERFGRAIRDCWAGRLGRGLAAA